jgi:hypothetical protein
VSNLPIDRVFLPDPRSPIVRELPFRLKVFSRRDIERLGTDRSYLCTYCDRRLPADYEPWQRHYRLCDPCERWYRHCFEARDKKWITCQYANMKQRVKSEPYERGGVEVQITEYEFHFLTQTLLVPFRFYYPFQRPSVDRHFRRSADWPHYHWTTIAIVPQPLNSALRDCCLNMEELVQLCRLLREPNYRGRNRDLAKRFSTSDRCISDLARGKRFQYLRKYDARILELFKNCRGETPEPTMWNWQYQINPDYFIDDPETHNEQLADLFKHSTFGF